MKRRLIAIIVVVVVLSSLAAGGYFGYGEIVRLRDVDNQFVTIRAERDALAAKVSASSADSDALAARLADASKKAAAYDAIKLALSGEAALQAIEKSIKESKGPTADQYLALGALRLIKHGEGDADSVAAFERALELANWPAAKQLTCAAQIGITAAGKQTELAADCGEMAVAPVAQAAAEGRRQSEAKAAR